MKGVLSLALLSLLLPCYAGAAASEGDSSQSSRVSPVFLEWEEITSEVFNKHGGHKTILHAVSGKADPGRLLAILGPSGSGKTTLLNVLANQVPLSKTARLTGRVYVNGVRNHADGEAAHTQAYIRQQDLFYSQLTVRETLLMAARLRLPDTLSLHDKYEYVEDLIGRMGLNKVADTIVGDEKTRGISGGEKKRLSLACELIGSPSLIFADEPTSGLDAFQAEILMKRLHSLAREGGHTVVVSIHQPRSSIFGLFDDIVLLSEGDVVYNGPADAMLSYFSELGHACPKSFNPAEFALDLVSIDYTNAETEADSRLRLGQLLASWRARRGPALLDGMRKRRPTLSSGGSTAMVVSQDGGEPVKRRSLRMRLRARARRFSEQFRLLFRRSWRQITRSKGANIARAMSNIFSAIVFGFFYFQLGNGQASVQDRMGLLQVAAINVAMSSLIKTITVFVTERLIVSRERSAGKKAGYGAGPYFLSKLAAELPVTAIFPILFGAIMYPMTGLQGTAPKFFSFLLTLIVESYSAAGLGMAVGCLVPSVDAGLAVAPAVMLLFLVLGGFFVNQASVPAVFRWLKDISLIKYAFEGLCINEFEGLTFNREGGGRVAYRTGEQVLDFLSFSESSVFKALGFQSLIMLSTWAVTYGLLATQKPKFQPVIDPDQPDKSAEDEEEGSTAGAVSSSSSSDGASKLSASILRSAARPRAHRRLTVWSPSGMRSSPKIFL